MRRGTGRGGGTSARREVSTTITSETGGVRGTEKKDATMKNSKTGKKGGIKIHSKMIHGATMGRAYGHTNKAAVMYNNVPSMIDTTTHDTMSSPSCNEIVVLSILLYHICNVFFTRRTRLDPTCHVPHFACALLRTARPKISSRTTLEALSYL